MVKLPRVLVAAAAAGALLAGLTAVPAPARAHPELMPTMVNRYATVAPAGTELGVTLSLLFGELPGGDRRGEIDSDHDGQLSDAELAAERERWAARAPQLLRVSLDGKALAVALAPRIDLGGHDEVGPKPLVVEFAGSTTLDPGQHRLGVEAGPDLPHMGETEIALDVGTPWTLHGGGGGTDPAETTAAQRLVRYPTARAKPDEPRAAVFLIRADGPLETGPGPSPFVPIVLVAFAVALGIALTLVVRKWRAAAESAR